MNDSIKYIQSLDLQYIVNRIVRQYKWKDYDAKETVRKYKNFLILSLLNPDFKIVPTRLIDIAWHEHILHTKKYMEDCDRIFGFYLHHRPSEHTEEEKEIIELNYIKTARLYEKQFQEPYGLVFDISIWF